MMFDWLVYRKHVLQNAVIGFVITSILADWVSCYLALGHLSVR